MLESFLNAVSAVLVLLMIIGLGYLLGRGGWMTAQEKRFFSKFIVNIAVPCNCLNGLLNNLDHDQLSQAALMVVFMFAGVVVTILFSLGVAHLLRLPQKQRGVFAAMGGLSNTLFVGLPLSTQLFGSVCVPYVMIYYLANTVLTQTVGISLIQRSGQGDSAPVKPLAVLKSVVTKPPVIAVVGSVLLLVLDLRPPTPIMSFAGYIGNSVAPLALIYCGFILYEIGLKNLRMERGIPIMLAIRFVLAPVLCYGLCRLGGFTGLARDVFIVESALPVVSQVVVLSGSYGADEHYAAMGSCISILTCFITIPILMVLLGGI